MTIKLFLEPTADQIFVQHGTIGSWPHACLQAVGNGDGTLGICNKSKMASDASEFLEIWSVPFADFIDFADEQWGTSEAECVDNLNSLFLGAPIIATVAPVYTAATAITVSTVESINYFAEATGAVGWEWGALPAGLAIAGNNPRNLIGTPSGGVGVYAVDVTAVNYYGSTTTTLTFTVTAAWANTRSLRMRNNDYLSATAAAANPFYRASNGAGAGDAWSASLWFKPAPPVVTQTIMSFGGSDAAAESQVRFEVLTADRFRLQYGGDDACLRLVTAASSLTAGAWHHIFVTYDGGTTGSTVGSVADYYSRFQIWIDGVAATTTDTHVAGGTSLTVGAEQFTVGSQGLNGSYVKGGHIDELALWGSDQTANVAAIYNAGAPHDLALLATIPTNWWRMGDGDTHPTISDQQAAAVHFTMFNMTAADITTDAP